MGIYLYCLSVKEDCHLLQAKKNMEEENLNNSSRSSVDIFFHLAIISKYFTSPPSLFSQLNITMEANMISVLLFNKRLLEEFLPIHPSLLHCNVPSLSLGDPFSLPTSYSIYN
jgi:hypothetical protein